MVEPTRTLRVRFYAGARAAAGTSETDLAVPVGATVGDALALVIAAHPGVARVLPACSVLLDEVRARPADLIRSQTVLDVLPPFSGG